MDSLLYLLIGAYTAGLSEGVYLYKFDSDTGDARYADVVRVENPSYIDVGDGKYLYAVTENTDGPSYANTLFFDREREKLTLLNRQETFASSPCYIAADTAANRHVLTANYGGGSISVFATSADTLLPLGQLLLLEGSGPDPLRQSSPHAHCVKFSPDGKYVFATDLGTDRIYRFDLNAKADTEPFLIEESAKAFELEAGSGPRHLAFHPSNKYLYVINELAGTIVGFHYREGELTAFQTIQADTLQGRGSADIGVAPNGKFLYASNRVKGDGIAVFSVNEADGSLLRTGYQPTGRHPRNFAITPNGKYLLAACRDSNRIEVFEIDEKTGALRNIGKDITDIDTPVLLKFIK